MPILDITFQDALVERTDVIQDRPIVRDAVERAAPDHVIE
jgi:hypothetical protein